MSASESRLPVAVVAAATFIKNTAAVAAERVLLALAVQSQAVTHLAERDVLLATQHELRQKLNTFQLAFSQALDERIRQELAPRNTSPRRATDWQSMSLVDDAEVEERMFSDRIAQQVSHACEWELRELAGFMGAVTGAGRAADESNPLRAAVLGHAVYRAIVTLTTDTDARRVLAREFGVAMSQAMAACYASVVQDLRARGVDPVGLSVKGVEGPGSGVNSGYETLRDDVPSTLGTGFDRGHPSSGSTSAPRRTSFGGTGSGTGPGSTLGAPYVDRRPASNARPNARPDTGLTHVQAEADAQLMSLLRRLTNLAGQSADAGEPQNAGASTASAFAGSVYSASAYSGSAHASSHFSPAPVGSGRSGDESHEGADDGLMAVNLIRAHRDELRQASTGKLDHMVIDVVGSLFDQILSDPRVPPQLARQIARLQLPVLRVALADASFFSSRRHPVRRFVNRMASLACAFDDFSDGPGLQFLNHVTQLVQDIVEGDFDQVELYAAKLASLEKFIAGQTDAQAQQSGAAKVLATKESELLTQQRYLQQLQAALVPISMPAYLRQFLCQVWSQALVLAAHRAGVESELSRRMRQAGRDVVLSVQPKGAPILRKRFLMQLPTLMKDLNQGLRLIGWPEAAQKQFFAQLLPSHSESLKGTPMSELDFNLLGKQLEAIFNQAIPGQDGPLPVEAPTSTVEPVSLASADVEQRFSAQEAQQVGLVAEQAVDWSGHVDIDLAAQHDARDDEPDTTPAALDLDINLDLATADPAEPSHGAQLFDHIRLGFAYNMHLKDEWHKVRLSYVSPGRSFFVFSRGRRHQESISLTSRMLARMCDTGRLRAVESAYLMERATARARKQLAAMKASSGPA